MDPLRAAVDVQDYFAAIGQVAGTSLRSIIGKSDLDDLLGDREKLNQGMELMIDNRLPGGACTSIGSRSRTSPCPAP